MKRATFLNLLMTSVMLATVASGCKKQPKNITPIGSNQRPIGGGTEPGGLIRPPDPGLTFNPGGAQGTQLDPSEIPAGMLDANEDRASLAQQTIYFDFDRSAVKPSEQPKLEQVGTYMKNTPGVQLKIEGHCDERGTEEYNRSLGERRAISAREFLIQKHNIESGRITTASYGEDKPVSLENTEEAYALNRRAEFVILRPD
jgi:peptidoglycan-associated lipoprotein